MNPDLVIIDGSYMLHRTLHVPTFQRLENGGTYGFMKSMRSVVDRYRPLHVIIVFDSGRSERRKSIYPEYKSNRDPATEEEQEEKQAYFDIYNQQLYGVMSLCSRLGIHIVRLDHAEGDDILDYVTMNFSGSSMIITDDADMLTMVSPRRSVFRPMADVEVTNNNFSEITGISDPYKFKWYKAMLGDACFTGDTKVSLLNGTEVPIKDLVGKDEFWVYSYDIKANKIVPGRAHSARLTKKKTNIVKVTLDNDEEIRCTPDHRFLMRDGTYKEAKCLKSTDSLMPLYRRKSSEDDRFAYGRFGYEVSHAGDMGWEFTHIIAADINNIGTCPICKASLPDTNHSMRHHRDFNKLNNDPSNLQWVKNKEHMKIHSDVIAVYNKSQKHRDTVRAMNSRLVKEGNHPFQSDTCKEKASINGNKSITKYNNSDNAYNKSADNKQRMSLVGTNTLNKLWSDKEFRHKMSSLISNRNTLRIQKLKKDDPAGFQDRMRKMSSVGLHRRWHVSRNIINRACTLCIGNPDDKKNHKVKSVSILDTPEDVYDFEVDDYHNFALSSGIFVHNSDNINGIKGVGAGTVTPVVNSMTEFTETDLLRACDTWTTVRHRKLAAAFSIIRRNMSLTDTSLEIFTSADHLAMDNMFIKFCKPNEMDITTRLIAYTFDSILDRMPIWMNPFLRLKSFNEAWSANAL